MAGVVSKATKFYTYARTMKSQTEYATRMKRLSNQIFGEVRRPTSINSLRVVDKLSKEPLEQREDWIQFYPAVEETTELMRVLRDYGLFRDEHKDFKEEMERLRALRGKSRVRAKWPGGVRPEKIIHIRYDKD